MAKTHSLNRPCLSDEEFEIVSAEIVTLADRLCDEQVLELADRCHEVLRQRRDIRARHPRLARPGAEDRSWASL